MRYIMLLVVLLGCSPKKKEGQPLEVVTTTTMLTDLVKQLVGEKMNVIGLMGAGVDPHLYKASEGDVQKIFNADAIFYNGLHLEGRLEEVFEKLQHQEKRVVNASKAIAAKELIASEQFASNYDPHFWFSIDIWADVADYLAKNLGELDAQNAAFYLSNAQQYKNQLKDLKEKFKAQIDSIEPQQRVLVTAHDAFNYFGQTFDFQVVGLQGISTATEAGVRDVQRLSQFIVKQKIKAIFVESSVPKRTVEALQEAVKAEGHEVCIGGTLYSDALGDKETPEGTYVGMYKHNVNTIVRALK